MGPKTRLPKEGGGNFSGPKIRANSDLPVLPKMKLLVQKKVLQTVQSWTAFAKEG
jgi:hypothetical protein